MSRKDHEIRITPSVLDRLLDYEPKNSQESPKSRSKSLSELKQSVRRDLEWLFNARKYIGKVDEKLEEIQASVAVYGLPDFTGIGVRDDKEQERMIKSLERAIKIFEPRFLNVKLTSEPISNLDNQLKFRIEASLDIEPTPEPIVFDTVLQIGSGEIEVKES